MNVRWIVSAERTPYHWWQCALFSHSAQTRCGVVPTIITHDPPGPYPSSPWGLIRNVYKAPRYRKEILGRDYPPRNTPGTLLEAAKRFSGDDWFVLFDPDMIFLRPVEFPFGWAADRVGYGPPGARVGVPYVVPARRAEELALEWLKVLDSALEWSWEMVMWAYVVAMRRLGVDYRETEFCDANFPPDRAPRPEASIIHYCYGDDQWTKRQFTSEPWEVFERIPQGLGVSIRDQICVQLREVSKLLWIGDGKHA